MKNSITALSVLSLALLTSSQVYAGSSTDTDQARSLVNTISIFNNTNNDIAYRVISTSLGDNLYGIKRGRNSSYNAKFGDTNATFEIGQCKSINFAGLCVEADASSITNCVGNTRYDAYHIKKIKINSLSSCTITCLDGSATSCIAK